MNITLQRINIKGEITEGKLVIDGLTICDTLENSYSALAPGHYSVHILKCRQYARKMLLLKFLLVSCLLLLMMKSLYLSGLLVVSVKFNKL